MINKNKLPMRPIEQNGPLSVSKDNLFKMLQLGGLVFLKLMNVTLTLI